LNRILVRPHFIANEEHVRLLQTLMERARENSRAAFSPAELSKRVFEVSGVGAPENEERLRAAYTALRAALAAYYRDKGRHDPVLFVLPENEIGIQISAIDVLLDQDEIDADAERSAVLPKDYPINIYAIIAMFVMALAGAAYFFGLDKMTTGPTGPETITDVGPLGQRLHSIAVIPFETDAGNPADGFFAAGITQELTARLGRIAGLRLIAPETMRRVATENRSPAEIAKTVDTRYVLHGKLSRTQTALDLEIALMRPDSGDTLWRHRYERGLETVSSLYADIGAAVTATLNAQMGDAAKVLPDKPPATPTRTPVDDTIEVRPGAYVTYLKARATVAENTPGALAQSIALFQASINSDSGLPRAHSGLTAGVVALAGYGFERIAPRPGMATAKKAAIDAMRLNEFYPEPYAYLGVIRTVAEWDWDGAERVYVYAIQFNPSYADARLFYSRFLEARGRRRDAIDQAERAHTLNPKSPVTRANRAWQYLQAGWFTRAREHFNAIRAEHPRSWIGHWGIAQYYWRRGDLHEAIEAFEQAAKADAGNTLPLASLGHLYAVSGQKQKALDVLHRIQMIGQARYVSPLHIAIVHAGLGDRDRALQWLEKAAAARSYGLAWINVTKEFDSLHNSPRYQALLERLKLYFSRPAKQP
jgi:serine/threonine-protein kinase